MARINLHSFLLPRLILSLALAACLSPQPELRDSRPYNFESFVASLPGDLRIVIWKSQYTLTLYKGEQPVKTYRAVFGKGYGDGDKQQMGDKRTPEGDFFICTMNRSKRFYKFMGVSYPGPRHAEEGLRKGLITQVQYDRIRKASEDRLQPPWDTRLGGAVGIHGRMQQSAVPAVEFPGMNWTDGCIALENADIDEIYSVASLGTPVTILP